MSAAAAVKKSMGRTQITIAPAGDATLMTIAGEMDDQATLSELSPSLSGKIIVDLGGVRFINSVGVREWIIFLHDLEEKKCKVVLRNCSERIVHQMNMVLEARGDAEVESFHAPYVCDKCGAEHAISIQVAPNREQLLSFEIPTQTCPDCGGTMQFDDLPNRYLLFLS
ncbi:MAG TPA: STAS domain-containing protein [Kofleriaceae bacterium]|jgi:anti-anti-sigma regulatory factor|nr:STAS domain-containing protein [Kofleriaceae bacterium]